MITKDALKTANTGLKTIDQKGKAYVMVNTRVEAFRDIEPAGGIATEILHLQDGVVVIKATITDEDGKVLSTGIASEKDGSSFVNKTSYIENCETSAVGRALGFLGIGIDGSMASADEVANAMLQQKMQETPATEFELDAFKEACTESGVDYKEIWRQTGKATDKSKAHLGLAQKRLVDITNARA